VVRLAERTPVPPVCPEPPLHLAVRVDRDNSPRASLVESLPELTALEAAPAEGGESRRIQREPSGTSRSAVSNGARASRNHVELCSTRFYSAGPPAAAATRALLSTAWRLAPPARLRCPLDKSTQGGHPLPFDLAHKRRHDDYVPATTGKRERSDTTARRLAGRAQARFETEFAEEFRRLPPANTPLEIRNGAGIDRQNPRLPFRRGHGCGRLDRATSRGAQIPSPPRRSDQAFLREQKYLHRGKIASNLPRRVSGYRHSRSDRRRLLTILTQPTRIDALVTAALPALRLNDDAPLISRRRGSPRCPPITAR